MALRVLLADESTTIKKVMQLALQDFAVEVKAVHVGVDVVEVARQFQPDIIFADVLLQKKNGYEVCTDLKADSQLRSIPVVLMWSSFMDLDETLAKSSGADRRLEKPFDIENLRTLLLELVPKTHTQRLAHFLKFPASFSEPLKTEEAKKSQVTGQPSPAVPTPAASVAPPKPTAPAGLKIPQAEATARSIHQGIASSMPHPPPSGPPPPPKHQVPDGTKEGWNMDSFEDISKFEPTSLSVVEETSDFVSTLGQDREDEEDDEVFSEMRLQGPQRNQPSPATAKPKRFDSDATATREIPLPVPSQDESDEAWSHQDLSRFKIEMPPVTASNPEFGIEMELPDESADYPLQPTPFQPRTSSAVEDAYLSNDRQPDNDLLLDRDEIESADFSLESSDFQLEHYQPPPAAHPLGSLELTSLEEEAEDPNESTYRIDNPLKSQMDSRRPPPSAGTRERAKAQSSDDSDFPIDEVGQIPQLSPERLEQIIRAQTREIVESVVRKIVPDLATNIIREELQRLLEDTSVRDPRRENY